MNYKVEDEDDKSSCFAWLSHCKCNALTIKCCKNCRFFKNRDTLKNYDEKHIEKNDKIERGLNLKNMGIKP